MKEEKGANDLLSLLPPYHIRHLHLATKGFQLCKAEAQHMGCSVLNVIWPGREKGRVRRYGKDRLETSKPCRLD